MDIKQEFNNLVKEGKYREALEFLGNLIQAGNESSAVYCNIAWLLGKLGRERESLPYLKKIEERKEPELKKWVYMQLARTYYDIKSFDDSYFYIDKCIRIGCEEPWLYVRMASLCNMRGKAALANGNWQEAYDYFKRAMTKSSKNAALYDNMGYAAAKLGLMDEAVELYKKSIEIEPHDGEAYFQLGRIASIREKYRDAIGYFIKAIKNGRNGANAYLEMGVAYIHMGNIENGINEIKHSIELDDTDVTAYNELGNAYVSIGDFANAIEVFKKSLLLESDKPEIIFMLGYCLGECGKFNDALLYFEKALVAISLLERKVLDDATVSDDRAEDIIENCHRLAQDIRQEMEYTKKKVHTSNFDMPDTQEKPSEQVSTKSKEANKIDTPEETQEKIHEEIQVRDHEEKIKETRIIEDYKEEPKENLKEKESEEKIEEKIEEKVEARIAPKIEETHIPSVPQQPTLRKYDLYDDSQDIGDIKAPVIHNMREYADDEEEVIEIFTPTKSRTRDVQNDSSEFHISLDILGDQNNMVTREEEIFLSKCLKDIEFTQIDTSADDMSDDGYDENKKGTSFLSKLAFYLISIVCVAGIGWVFYLIYKYLTRRMI